MKKITDKEWYEENKNIIDRRGAIFKINNKHPFGVVHDGEMKCLKRHSFEIFESTGTVNVFLNDNILTTIAEVHDKIYGNNVKKPSYSLNTLYQAQNYIDKFIDENKLKDSKLISIKVELSITRKIETPHTHSIGSNSIDGILNSYFHYDFKEALIENPENKIFRNGHKKDHINLANRTFDSEIYFDSKKDGLRLTDEKIKEIRDSIVARFDANSTPMIDETNSMLTYNSVIQDILKFEWDSNNNKIKHWNNISFYSKKGKKKELLYTEVHNKPFSVHFSNNIQEFFMSSFGFVSYDIDVIDNEIIAKSNISKEVIRTDSVNELLFEINKKLGEVLLNISKNDSNNFFKDYGLPIKSMDSFKLIYNSEDEKWITKDISLIPEEKKLIEEKIIKELNILLNNHSELNWDSELREYIKMNNDLPHGEKRVLYSIVEEYFYENECIIEDDVEQYVNTNIKSLNLIFEVE